MNIYGRTKPNLHPVLFKIFHLWRQNMLDKSHSKPINENDIHSQ